MTVKIERASVKHGTLIRLSGEFRSEHLVEVWTEIQRGGSEVTLDLDEVDLVDVEAIRFLNACEAEGLEVRNCSLYIREWMIQEKASERNPRGGTQ
jgi:ABC-type transporter Mla MlaB component